MLTDTQLDWADAQIGEQRSAALVGKVTEVKPGRREGFVLTVDGEDGSATIAMNTTSEVAAANRGESATVLIEGTVTDLVLDEELGRVGLVIDGDNGRVVEWVTPERGPDETPEPTPEAPVYEPTAEEIAAAEVERAKHEANAAILEAEYEGRQVHATKRRLLLLLGDEEVVAALKEALA